MDEMKEAGYQALKEDSTSSSLTKPLHRNTLMPDAKAIEVGHKVFAGVLLGVQLVIMVLFGFFLEYDFSEAEDSTLDIFYFMYVGVALMMFVGFGYLMTFLKWYGLGAVGWSMLITCLGVEWSLLTIPFFGNLYSYGFDLTSWAMATLNMEQLMAANFAVAAFLISFGALIGKVSPIQILLLVIMESVFYAANDMLILEGALKISDTGGTIIIHMFGAYYGLAVSYALGVPKDRGTKDEKSGYQADLFSLVGTVFLWLYWPSFVAGDLEPNSDAQARGLLNTVVALLGSTVVTFAISAMIGGRISPVHVQNSTLAGGVAIGATANLSVTPAGALLIGIVSGVVSVLGYSYLLEKLVHIGIHDTCGVHNLHGMPSVIGGLAAVLVAAIYPNPDIYEWGQDVQWLKQLGGVLCTLAMAIGTGLLTGVIIRPKEAKQTFNDNMDWEVADDFHKSA